MEMTWPNQRRSQELAWRYFVMVIIQFSHVLLFCTFLHFKEEIKSIIIIFGSIAITCQDN